MQSYLSKDNSVTCLFSTVKKSKQINQLHHAKSYDDIFLVHELDPCEVKILLNNDRSLKSIHKPHETCQNPNLQQNNHDEISFSNSNRQNKETLSKVLEESVKKQNLLMQKNLFDPFKYFGSSSQTTSIQQSSRHHQSRLEAMFSQNNSPMPTDHSASYRKKSPLIKNQNSKIVIDGQRISNTVLFSKLEKLVQVQKKTKQNTNTKIKYDTKTSLKNTKDKENHAPNGICQESNRKSKLTDTKPVTYEPYTNFNIQKSKITENHENTSFYSNKKMSIQNKSSVSRSNQVNCSPKSYVKDAKEKYLKMNINSLQKVRLKLKLTSKN